MEIKELITIEQYFKGQPPTEGLRKNAEDLLRKVNSLLQELGVTSAKLSSGYRSPAHNAAVGGAKLSNHMLAKAVDLEDFGQKIGSLCLANLGLLKKRGMALEDLGHTPTWCHLQSVLPKSGRTVFIP